MSASDDRGRIRTPDQQLRVFVSSTLRELEAERRAVRGAIERLRLAPVMFELGARPHPPRDLYRAYLEQSDVFVGIPAPSASLGWRRSSTASARTTPPPTRPTARRRSSSRPTSQRCSGCWRTATSGS